MIFDLKTNDNVCPVSVSDKAFLSFKVKGFAPKTYRITVKNGETTVFDSAEKPFGTVKTEVKAKLSPCTRYDWTVTVTGENGETESASSFFETALLNGFAPAAKWINDGSRVVNADTKEGNPAMYFKKKFTLDKVPGSARLYYCPLGAGEAYLNGKRVGEGVLSPAYSRYDKRAFYLAENVDGYLKEGENVLCVILGDGFYNQTVDDTWSYKHAVWRDTARLLLQLNVDGKPVVVSDESWTMSHDGPITYNAIRNGEHYDARKEFDWLGETEPKDLFFRPCIATPVSGTLLPMEMPEIKITERIAPVSVTPTPDGNWIFDFGQNFVGFAELNFAGKAGQKISLYYGEKLKDGKVDKEEIGRYIHSNVVQTDEYTFKDENPVKWHARFAYYGFQYVEVAGVTEEPPLSMLTGLRIHTAFSKIGNFRSSDATLNKIYEIGEHSFVSNYHGIPTDCPQREKNGWTGDTQLSAEQALMNYDVASSYKKWIAEFQDSQRQNGQLSCIVPASYWGYNWGFGPAWDTCYFVVPYLMKRYRGDSTVYAEIYESAKKYIDGFCSYYDEGNLLSFGLGDWCFPARPKKGYEQVASGKLTDSAYYFLNVKILADMAKTLGKRAEAKKYTEKAEAIRRAIVKEFVNVETGEVDNNSQTSLACVVFHDIVDKKTARKVARRLERSVRKAGYHYYAGILGCKWIFTSLSRYGYTETAYRSVVNPEYPSYGNWVARGASTMWEDWEEGFSRNHHMYSDIIGWMIKYVAGLRLDDKADAYASFIAEPKMIEELTFAEAETDSAYGKVAVSWKKDGKDFTMKVTVPCGAKATAILPDGTKEALSSGEHTLTCTL